MNQWKAKIKELEERLRWVPCTEAMPKAQDPKDPKGTRVVLATGDNREPGLVQVDVMNVVYFTVHWQKRGYTHWMYCPDPPHADAIRAKFDADDDDD